MSKPDARVRAARVLQSLLSQQGSLATQLGPEDDALTRELCFGSCRWYQLLDACLAPLLSKPLKRKDQDVRCLLIVGLYQLQFMRIPAHAAVNETVAATRGLKKPWAKNLVNAVLRAFQRQQETLISEAGKQPGSAWSHPDWLVEALQAAWPDHWQSILEANNCHPPMTLRLNQWQLADTGRSREDWLAALAEQGMPARPGALAETAVYLDSAVAVDALPGFHEGEVSVQDEASQLVAELLAAQSGQRILDACAAPGGKTAHILERSPNVQLLALDIEQRRLQRIKDNLSRLHLQAELRCADARKISSWWDGQVFDRILLDAPCSATGIIRRQPDIKLLRRADDIPRLVQLQQELLDALWPCLAPGGLFLYTTCSVLPAENSQQVEAFLHRHSDALLCELPEKFGLQTAGGRQLLPAESGQGPDGFFFALIQKQ